PGLYQLGPLEDAAVVADVEVLRGEVGLPVPGEPREIRFERRRGVPPPALLVGADGTLEARAEGDETLRYRVAAAPRPDADALADAARILPPPEVARFLEIPAGLDRSEEHTSELQSRENLVCRLLLEKKKYA